MKLSTLVLLLVGMVTMTTVHGQNVARVNGVAIPQSRLDFVVKSMTAQGQPDSPELRDRLRDELINREIVAQESAKKGLDKNPEVATQIVIQRQGILINAYLQDYLRTRPISEDVMRKEYDRIKAETGGKEYRARHILVEKEDEAKDIIAQIKKGASFEKIASEKSKDQGSKARGGDLDWAPASRYVAPFGEAIAKLKKGQMTDAPVNTQFGWHVIQLEDERAMKFPAFEEAKPQIQQQLQQQAVTKAISELRAKAKIE